LPSLCICSREIIYDREREKTLKMVFFFQTYAKVQQGHVFFILLLSFQLVYWKRYTDIRKLYDTLCRYHQAIFRPGKFPDIPAKPGFIGTLISF